MDLPKWTWSTAIFLIVVASCSTDTFDQNGLEMPYDIGIDGPKPDMDVDIAPDMEPDPDMGFDPNGTYGEYLELAERSCTGAGDQILLSSVGFGEVYGSFQFEGELGSRFFYVTDSCELFTEQKCIIDRRPDSCVGESFPWSLPYTRTRLTTKELALMLHKMRVLEWEDAIPIGGFFKLALSHDSMFLIRFRDHFFVASQSYTNSEIWDSDPPDVEKWGDLLTDLDYLLHASVSLHGDGFGFTSPLKEAVFRSEEFTQESVHLAVTRLPSDLHWLDERFIFDWPLSQSPAEFHVVEDEYCYGTSSRVFGPDAVTLRELIRSASAVEIPNHLRRHVIPVRYGDEIFGIGMRESLPIEGENGLIEGVWDAVFPGPICTFF